MQRNGNDRKNGNDWQQVGTPCTSSRRLCIQSQIKLSKNDKIVNGKSILSIPALGAEQGNQVILQADGNDAEPAVSTLASLLEGDLR